MSATTFPFTLAAFSAQCASSFVLPDVDGMALVLSAAEPLHAHAPDERRFSLMFSGPLAPALQQGTHTLDHPVLGSLAIFLVPVARDARGMHYQAIFH